MAKRGKYRVVRRRGKPTCKPGPAYSPELPVEGFYRLRLRRGGPFVAIRIWLGPPLDPETGEEMDNRSWRWQARLNGTSLVPIGDYWPRCARTAISQSEHDKICRLSATMDPTHPYYDPSRPADRLHSPMPC